MTSWLNNVDDAQLRESIEQLISAYPDSLPVVQRLIDYYNDKLARTENEEEREHKKRKIDPSPTTDIIATVVDISFQLPARKKYNLILTSHQFILVNPKTDQVEHTFDLPKVQIGVCVPSPAPAKGHTFALFFAQPDTDPICFSIQQQNTIKRSDDSASLDENKHVAITQLLAGQGVKMTQPSKPYFMSTLVSATTGKRTDEDRFYANAYLKAKEGSLYFLPEGILYGFKKPVSFYPLTCLASTFYSGITQHTFNLSLVLHKGNRPLGSAFITVKDDDEATVEFSMIEQSEYGGIDGYIKKIGVNDKSMSEENMAPETKARIVQQSDEKASPHDDDEDEESDHDFQPSDGDVDPLEYDSEAGSSDEEDDVMEERHDHDEHSASDGVGQESEDEIDERRLMSSEQDHIVVSDDAAEQDITRTDNESDEEEEVEEEEEELQATEDDVEEEEEVVDEEEEEEEDDARSESLGSSSEDDIDEDMQEAVIPDDAKDELDDSD